MNKTTFKAMMTIAIVLSIGYASASIDAQEGRAVYHSQCEISENPVRFERTSGKNNKWRKWVYRDTVNDVEIKADKDQHDACESVKVLMASEIELAEANRLESVATRWLVSFMLWVAFMGIVEFAITYLPNRRERLDRLKAEAERELEAEARAKFWVSYAAAKEAERVRSRSANEERAKRKAERGAVLEARRVANLESKKG